MKKNITIRFRATNLEYARVWQAAKDSGMTMSEYMRKMIFPATAGEKK